MLNTILKDNHPSRPAFASCIEQHLQRPEQQIRCSTHQLSSHFNDTLQMAIKEQMQISWHRLFLEYMSKKWLMLSAMDTSTGTLNLAAERSRGKFYTKGNDPIGPRTIAWKKSSSLSQQ
jgi:hypothetical protein